MAAITMQKANLCTRFIGSPLDLLK